MRWSLAGAAAACDHAAMWRRGHSGAPNALQDAAGCALAAGRELAHRLEGEGMAAGVGLSAGPAVAGWLGAEQRPKKVLAAEAIVDRAAAGEAARWTLGEAVTLRGRSTPTRLGFPA